MWNVLLSCAERPRCVGFNGVAEHVEPAGGNDSGWKSETRCRIDNGKRWDQRLVNNAGFSVQSQDVADGNGRAL
jgi:hypothetical protein